jgi:hypothetical protein
VPEPLDRRERRGHRVGNAEPGQHALAAIADLPSTLWRTVTLSSLFVVGSSLIL